MPRLPEESFASYVLQAQQFRPRWQISVDAINTESTMMLHVILLEHHRIGYAYGKVCKHGEASIGFYALERQIVRDFMDLQRHVNRLREHRSDTTYCKE